MVADPVLLRGLGFTSDGGFQAAAGKGLPSVLEFTEPDFVSRFLYQVGQVGDPTKTIEGPGRRDLAQRATDVGGVLYQPVHRIFYLAVLEVVCDTFGQPRLDPAKIDSAGMVIRRVSDGGQPDRWVGYRDKLRWWATHAQSTEDSDPDEARRPVRARTGDPVLDAQLDEAANVGSNVGLGVERITRLFVAPKALCAGAGHTILFGALQLASSEVETDPQAQAPTYSPTDDIAAAHGLPHYFRQGVNISLNGVASRTYTTDDVAGFAANDPAMPKNLDHFVKMLGRMVAEFDLLGDGGAALVGALNGVSFTYDDGSTSPMGDALVQAAGLFVTGDKAVTSVTMPSAWPVLTPAQASAIAAAAGAAASARLSALLPKQGRFDKPGALYQVRAFVRVKRDDGCPPQLLWSDYSPPFEIASWYDRAPGQAPIQIPLPAVTPENVKSFVPNVAFNVPPSISNLLSANSPDDFLKGKAKAGGAGGLAWICGFNIPIITLCAFIVLNIFLSLLNIVFWWMAFIKICIPVPASLKAKLPNGLVK
jgi:hypothetical protein